MEDLRLQFNRADREQAQRDINDLRCYILPILLDRQDGVCAICGLFTEDYDIDHLVYNPEVTVNELQALCWPCHKAKTNFIPFRNRKQ